ncbi:MAG: hypothetical protein M3P34_11210, partial [Actinomycetota bacterium]|nr:hypothetical protein [Actinomycetota bacterium]
PGGRPVGWPGGQGDDCCAEAGPAMAITRTAKLSKTRRLRGERIRPMLAQSGGKVNGQTVVVGPERVLSTRMLRRRLCALLALVLVPVVSIGGGGGAPAGAYPLGEGYWLAASDGGIFAFGDAQFFGSTGAIRLNKPIVGMAPTPFLEGYWLVASDGGIFSFGSAGFFGSTGAMRLNQPIAGMAPHPTGLGYWLVATDGGIFSFGDAGFQGSTGSIRLNRPIVGMASTPSGNGYWLVATDGGIFAFGDAQFYGSTGAIRLNRPIVGMASTPSGNGYWLVATDGGIFSFGDAEFYGSAGDIRLNAPIVGMAATRDGRGYQLVATDGGIFNYGTSRFFGSTGGIRLNQPILGMGVRPVSGDGGGPLVKVDAFGDSPAQTSVWSLSGDDWRLTMNKKTGDPNSPAGARVYGVEGLQVDQLGTLGFTVESGPCSAGSPGFTLYYDTNGDGAGDANRSFGCATGGGGAVKSWNPAALGVPGSAVVTGLDIPHGTVGTTSVIDDVRVAGATVTDFNVFGG